MQRSKLITLLKHLDSRECTRFVDYVHSPFYNKHREVKELSVYLLKYLKDPKKQHRLDKQKILKFLYPTGNPQLSQLHAVANKLLTLLQDFLVVTAQEVKKNTHYIRVLAELRKRKQYKDYEAILRKIYSKNVDVYEVSEDLFWEKFNYHRELDTNFITKGGRSYNENLQLKNDYLELFFIAKKLKIACDMLNRNRILGSDYKIRLIDELFVYLNQTDIRYKEEPIIRIYSAILNMLLKKDDDIEYQKVKELLSLNSAIFSSNEIKTIYDYLENYCILQYKKNTADDRYLREMLNIYKYLVQHQINYIDGFLPESDYKNIGTTAINLNDFEWAKSFIEDYQSHIPSSNRNSVYAYLMAFLNYAIKDYEASLVFLQDVNFTHWTYHCGAKLLQMRIYYETQAYESLLSLADAFRNYLKRNQHMIEKHQLPYLNFIKVTRKLTRLVELADYVSASKYKIEYDKLYAIYAASSTLASKQWLQAVIQGLEP